MIDPVVVARRSYAGQSVAHDARAPTCAARRLRMQFGRTEMMSLYVGITDYDWFRSLFASPSIEEVNF